MERGASACGAMFIVEWPRFLGREEGAFWYSVLSICCFPVSGFHARSVDAVSFFTSRTDDVSDLSTDRSSSSSPAVVRGCA